MDFECLEGKTLEHMRLLIEGAVVLYENDVMPLYSMAMKQGRYQNAAGLDTIGAALTGGSIAVAAGITAEPTWQPIFVDGKRVYTLPTLAESRAYVHQQLHQQVWEEEQRIQNPHVHYVDMSPRLYELKMNMLHSSHAGKEC